MNIYAKQGDKVKVTEETIENGYYCDSLKVKELLELNKVYTVDHMEVGRSYSSVILKEFPDLMFNSVNFEDA